MRFLVILFSFLLINCQLSEEDERKAQASMEDIPDQTSTNVDITYSENAIIKVKLKAPLAIMQEEGGKSINEFPDGLIITFFNKQGEKNANLYADYGYDDQVTGERFVKGNVKIIKPQGVADSTIFLTDELYIDEKKDSVHNNGGFAKQFDTQGNVYQGYGLTSNTRMDFLRLNNVFETQVIVEENEMNNEQPGALTPSEQLKLDKDYER